MKVSEKSQRRRGTKRKTKPSNCSSKQSLCRVWAGTANTFRKMLGLSEVKWNELKFPSQEKIHVVAQDKLVYQIF